jgi:hypothetical protein
LVTNFVGAGVLGATIFGSIDSGPLLGTVAVAAGVGAVVAPVAPVASVVGVTAAGGSFGGCNVCAPYGAGTTCAVSELLEPPHAASNTPVARTDTVESNLTRIERGRLANSRDNGGDKASDV